jgi:hypothetical protein
MDFDFDDIGTTLATGLYFFFSIQLLIIVLTRRTLPLPWLHPIAAGRGAAGRVVILDNQVVQPAATTSRETADLEAIPVAETEAARSISWGWMLIFFTLCFALGMLLEDVSNKFVDKQNLTQALYLLPSDEYLRTEGLFGRKLTWALFWNGGTSADPNEVPKIDPLAREAATVDAIARFGGPKGAAVQGAIQAKNYAGIKFEDLSDAANTLYYTAKNSVFGKSTYFSEMTKIQTRVDFARSFAIISLVLCLISIALVLCEWSTRWSWWNSQWQTAKLKAGILSAGGDVPHNVDMLPLPSVVRTRLWLCIPAFLACYGLGRFAFYAEEIEFDHRAFGYFITILREPSQTKHGQPAATVKSLDSTLPGFSGIAKYSDERYVVVHDIKSGDAPRLGMLTVNQYGPPAYVPIPITGTLGDAVDLEAICSIPDEYHFFLAVESSGKRVFRFQVMDHEGGFAVAKVDMIPLSFRFKGQLEGIACERLERNRFRLFLAEREGRLHWYTVEIMNDILISEDDGHGTCDIPLPAEWKRRLRSHSRPCSDLYLENKELFTVCAHDQYQDFGPFDSAICSLGTPDWSKSEKIMLNTDMRYEFSSLKVEGLAGGLRWSATGLCIATDDENYGGIWRPVLERRK